MISWFQLPQEHSQLALVYQPALVPTLREHLPDQISVSVPQLVAREYIPAQRIVRSVMAAASSAPKDTAAEFADHPDIDLP